MKIKKIIPFLLAALIFLGFVAHSFFLKDRTETILKPLPQGVKLAWPSVGQAAIGSMEDGVLAYSSDNEKLRPIASITKVITALAIMEKQSFKPGQKGQTYSITENDIERLKAYKSEGGSVLPILMGMKLTQHQAMQRMLIASDNNMADILVERIFGSMEAYISYAQNMLKRMGLSRTVVADASGFSRATVSTPSELIAIGIAALKNPVVAKIVSQQKAKMPVVGTIKNTNEFLGTDGVIGIKTGTTVAAGSCLLFAASYIDKDGQKDTIVGVIMGDKNHKRLYKDSKDLLASAKLAFTKRKVTAVAQRVAHGMSSEILFRTKLPKGGRSRLICDLSNGELSEIKFRTTHLYSHSSASASGARRVYKLFGCCGPGPTRACDPMRLWSNK